MTERCSCGASLPMVQLELDGEPYERPMYTVWDGGMDFGKPSMVQVCKNCYDKYQTELDKELELGGCYDDWL